MLLPLSFRLDDVRLCVPFEATLLLLLLLREALLLCVSATGGRVSDSSGLLGVTNVA